MTVMIHVYDTWIALGVGGRYPGWSANLVDYWGNKEMGKQVVIPQGGSEY